LSRLKTGLGKLRATSWGLDVGFSTCVRFRFRIPMRGIVVAFEGIFEIMKYDLILIICHHIDT